MCQRRAREPPRVLSPAHHFWQHVSKVDGQEPPIIVACEGRPVVESRLIAPDALRVRASWAPVIVVAGLVVAYGTVFFSVTWPYTDVYRVMDEATRWNWRQYVTYAFGAGVEYRPLFTLAVKALYQVVGLRLWFYHTVVLAQFTVVLALMAWLCRGTGYRRALAAAVTVVCLCGLHTTRILFGFWPLNHHSAGLALLLMAIALALQPHRRSTDWVYFLLTLIALLLLESGVVILPVLVILWWARAPGLHLRSIVATAAAVVIYAGTRFALSGTGAPPAIYAESGLGFSQLSLEDLQITFEHAPWMFWVYNVVATFLTVVASEPRAGAYRFTASLLNGSTPFWMWLHIGSSLLTTAVIVVGLRASRPVSGRDRLLLVTAVALIVLGSGLGFLYTRDRIGLTAGLGYSLLLYVALAGLLDHFPRSGWKRWVAAAMIALVAAAWVVRSGETYFQLRDSAWDFRNEWVVRQAEITAQPQTEVLITLRSAALGSSPADPRRDPAWSYQLFERRFDREGQARALPDVAADAATRPFSSPFDVRWTADVDEPTRRSLESELGLTDGEPVTRDPGGRTWTYRLREPSRDRIRAIVRNPSVEDTARIDTARFEIQR